MHSTFEDARFGLFGTVNLITLQRGRDPENSSASSESVHTSSHPHPSLRLTLDPSLALIQISAIPAFHNRERKHFDRI